MDADRCSQHTQRLATSTAAHRRREMQTGPDGARRCTRSTSREGGRPLARGGVRLFVAVHRGAAAVLDEEEGDQQAAQRDCGADDHRELQAERVGHRLERGGAERGAGLAHRRGEAVERGADVGGEGLGGEDEGGRVGAEVGEEEGEAVEQQHEQPACERLLERRVEQPEQEEDERHEEEALQLDGAPAESVHQADGAVVPRQPQRADDCHLQAHIGLQPAVERRPRLAAGGRGGVHLEHLLEDGGLEERVAVESDVEEEPAARRAEQQAPVLAHPQR
eukprot:CAMPEP_0184376946 /NCGR_PEP_ID=MMETSP0007-20130409/1858_1 /TAXON_ID=97485 /ORGANISM="Prymnesium parvum, Strain Texoma1" /LENGTH=277 /DNA_ID=CAMNT_0026720665 /DNA_START=363 /DNA_END=1192 /DNA_ORIENTATION=+